MKIRKEQFAILAILGAAAALGVGCNAQKIPTAPAPTNTPTYTSTITKTPTITSTPTITGTPTFTGTPTLTGTPTFTATQTGTPTFTFTLTATYPPGTDSPTPLPTSTATNTPTNTSTNTGTPTSTAASTITNTPSSSYPLTITVDYTGSLGAVATSVYDIQVSQDPNFVAAPATIVQVGSAITSSSPGPTSVTLSLAPGTYYVGAELNLTGAGKQFPVPSNDPIVGSPYAAFNGITNSDYGPSFPWADAKGNSATAINLTNSGASIGVTFGDPPNGNVGFTGGPSASTSSGGATLKYTSSDGVTVGSTVEYFWAQVFEQDPSVNGTGSGNQTPANDWTALVSSNMSLSCMRDLTSSSSVYVLLYLDPTQPSSTSNGTLQQIQVGDPYVEIGPVNPQTADLTKTNGDLGVTIVTTNTWP